MFYKGETGVLVLDVIGYPANLEYFLFTLRLEIISFQLYQKIQFV